MKKILSLLLVVVFFSYCGEYQSALKSEDVAVKFDLGTKLYDAGNTQKQFVFLSKLLRLTVGNRRPKNCFICLLNRIIKPNNII
jgi:hypothetical protein